MNKFSTKICDKTEAINILNKLDNLLRINAQDRINTVGKFSKLFESFPFPLIINTGFLKLSDLYTVSNYQVRLSIYEVISKSRNYIGMISNRRMFIESIYGVLYSNDLESKSLTLRLFGVVAKLVVTQNDEECTKMLTMIERDPDFCKIRMSSLSKMPVKIKENVVAGNSEKVFYFIKNVIHYFDKNAFILQSALEASIYYVGLSSLFCDMIANDLVDIIVDKFIKRENVNMLNSCVVISYILKFSVCNKINCENGSFGYRILDLLKAIFANMLPEALVEHDLCNRLYDLYREIDMSFNLPVKLFLIDVTTFIANNTQINTMGHFQKLMSILMEWGGKLDIETYAILLALFNSLYLLIEGGILLESEHFRQIFQLGKRLFGVYYSLIEISGIYATKCTHIIQLWFNCIIILVNSVIYIKPFVNLIILENEDFEKCQKDAQFQINWLRLKLIYFNHLFTDKINLNYEKLSLKEMPLELPFIGNIDEFYDEVRSVIFRPYEYQNNFNKRLKHFYQLLFRYIENIEDKPFVLNFFFYSFWFTCAKFSKNELHYKYIKIMLPILVYFSRRFTLPQQFTHESETMQIFLNLKEALLSLNAHSHIRVLFKLWCLFKLQKQSKLNCINLISTQNELKNENVVFFINLGIDAICTMQYDSAVQFFALTEKILIKENFYFNLKLFNIYLKALKALSHQEYIVSSQFFDYSSNQQVCSLEGYTNFLETISHVLIQDSTSNLYLLKKFVELRYEMHKIVQSLLNINKHPLLISIQEILFNLYRIFDETNFNNEGNEKAVGLNDGLENIEKFIKFDNFDQQIKEIVDINCFIALNDICQSFVAIIVRLKFETLILKWSELLLWTNVDCVFKESISFHIEICRLLVNLINCLFTSNDVNFKKFNCTAFSKNGNVIFNKITEKLKRTTNMVTFFAQSKYSIIFKCSILFYILKKICQLDTCYSFSFFDTYNEANQLASLVLTPSTCPSVNINEMFALKVEGVFKNRQNLDNDIKIFNVNKNCIHNDMCKNYQKFSNHVTFLPRLNFVDSNSINPKNVYILISLIEVQPDVHRIDKKKCTKYKRINVLKTISDKVFVKDNYFVCEFLLTFPKLATYEIDVNVQLDSLPQSKGAKSNFQKLRSLNDEKQEFSNLNLIKKKCSMIVNVGL
ncbi:hypothetical protein A3Q56_02172 [Intoshia linei]|uniref:Integrator complex subunit 7 n=1 Tax=Intoshia linei TaxID=1819745 RepID=A0A177B8T6_9BILA|nr:hypothetical protein A3Q56_02172 [Intoshia linei]